MMSTVTQDAAAQSQSPPSLAALRLDSDEEQGPRSGHLGTSWEIAVVTVFIVLIFAILGAVLFQIRRKKRMRRRQQDEEAAAAASGTATPSRRKPRTSKEEQEAETEPEPERRERKARGSRNTSPIDKPRPTASPARHGKTSPHRHSKEVEYYDHPSQKPPNWYWESSKR